MAASMARINGPVTVACPTFFSKMPTSLRAPAALLHHVAELFASLRNHVLMVVSGRVFCCNEGRAMGRVGAFDVLRWTLLKQKFYKYLLKNNKTWIENPRVGGSIPPPGTILTIKINNLAIAHFYEMCCTLIAQFCCVFERVALGDLLC